MTDKQALYDTAKQAVLKQKLDQGIQIANQAIELGVDPMDMMENGFIPGISEVGDLFGKGRLFLPELVQAADVMKAVTEVLNAALPEKREESRGSVLIATVQGDVHDIGKGIVVAMLRANGFSVHDMGRDVSCDRIIEAAIKNDVKVIGTSALLTTTMTRQKELEQALADRDLKDRFKTVVGGAPVTSRWARRIGADAYAADAQEAVMCIRELLGA